MFYAMTNVLRCAGVFLAAISAFGADPKWIRMPSEDFEIYSSDSEADTRRVLQYFERVRSFFREAMGAPARQKAEPVRIILFGSKKEYEEYRPNEFAIAYYTPIAGRDYIVMNGSSADVFPVAVHEYVHLIAQNAGLKLPPWLNEGVADLFSTLKPAGDKTVVGSPVPGHVYSLARQKWVPLPVILSAGHDSPYYNEKSKAGSLYSESWALVHMLLSTEYGSRFTQLLEEVQKDTPSQRAIETVYGKSLDVVEKDLQAYLRRNSFPTRIAPFKFGDSEKVAAETAALFDVKLALLDLANRPGKEQETRERLEDLTREDPKRPEPHVALGYLNWRQERRDAALKAFQTAVELGSRNPQMLWDYGRMAGGAQPKDAARALNLLVADQPARNDVRLALARIQMNQKQTKEALETLNPIKKVSAEDAPLLFQIQAYASVETGNRTMARAYTMRWIENIKDADERVRANRFLKYLDEMDAAPARAAGPPSVPLPPLESGAAPRLARREGPGANAEPAPAPVRPSRPTVSGMFVELNCQGPSPVFVIQTDSNRVSIVIDDPKLIEIDGSQGQMMDLNCGSQKPVSVRMTYDSPPAGQQGVLGVARGISFEPAK